MVWLRITLMLGITIAPSVLSMADDAASFESDEQIDLPQHVIVLLNGRVIHGEVVQRPGGYLIENTVGQMVIPFTQVRLTATDLPDAYRKLKSTMTEPTANGHVALGQWCFDNRLYDSAREQVKAALILEPERKQARTLLKDIERIKAGENLGALTPPPATRSRDGFKAGPVESLDGLSSSVTQDYVRRIQPLLMNKCGNVSCHGTAGQNDFRLSPVRLGMSGYRTVTDQNLSAVLGIIDFRQPQRSPLILVPQGTHGGTMQVWSGPRAEEQMAELRSWVTRVALENGSGTVGSAAETTEQSADGQPVRDEYLQQILAEERTDLFDPAIFNRLMHGRE